jgi:phosphonoacetaldehyde hydrolase
MFRPYQGQVTAVIFDWAGTILDFGCMAPVAAFRQAFAEAGVPIDEAEAREPMGAAKREHVELILAQAGVQKRWQATTGRASTSQDVDRLYQMFLRVDGQICARYADLIPGALETIATLRARGVRIGSTTGYPRSIMDSLMPLAAEQGYRPDHCVTVSEVRGRPYPDMVLANALALEVPDVSACVVVDDSPTGLVSARAAGMWAIGVVASGNEVGLPLDAWQSMCREEQDARRVPAAAALMAAGAHDVIDTVAELVAAIDRIEARLRSGERP